jgi:hypothetical protein
MYPEPISPGAIAQTSFTNLAALELFDARGQPHGRIIFVESLKAYWSFNPSGTLTPDGITVVSALGGGQWSRLDLPHLEWKMQQTWHIDPVGGNDENTGLSFPGAALKTAMEYTRRVGGYDRDVFNQVDLFIHGDLPATDLLLYGATFHGKGANLVFHGVPTTLRTSTLTGFTQYNQGSATGVGTLPTSIADGTFDFTPLIGKQLHITTGAAAGARGNVIKAPSAGHARIDWLTQPDPGDRFDVTFPTPSPGDGYEIVSLPTVHAFSMAPPAGFDESDITIVPPSIELLSFTGADPDSFPSFLSGTTSFVVYYCQFTGAVGVEGGEFIGCLCNGPGAFMAPLRSCTLVACCMLNGAQLYVEQCQALASAMFLQNGVIIINAGGSYESHHLGSGTAIFDTDSAITFQQAEAGDVTVEGVIWGQNNTTCIINLNAGCRMITSSSYISGLLHGGMMSDGNTEFIVNGKRALPRVNPSTFTSTAPTTTPTTFLNFAALFSNGGFQGQMFDPLSPTTGAFAQA